MRNGLVGVVASALLSLAAQGCVSVPGAGVTSASDIAVDAVALNDAFGRAMNGQILLNALRARDRWPRQYVNLTGIINQPTLSYSAGITFDPLPFNNAVGPFRASNAGPLSRTQSSAYNYGIAPLSAADVNRVMLTPVSRELFERYWEETNWPRDVLLLVMARSFQRYLGTGRLTDGAVRTLMDDEPVAADWGPVFENRFTNEEDDDAQGCAADETFTKNARWTAASREPGEAGQQRCAAFRIIHRMADVHYWRATGAAPASVGLRDTVAAPCIYTQTIPVGGASASGALIQGFAASAANSGGDIELELTGSGQTATLRLKQCKDQDDPVLLEIRDGAGEVQATYRVRLRSLDDMIFAMGALLRPQGAEDGARPSTRLLARAPCDATETRLAPNYCAIAPLFAATDERVVDPRIYAARVDYQGRRYFAGPSYAQSPDRTASVITLLSQIFTLNAGDAPPPPQRVNTN